MPFKKPGDVFVIMCRCFRCGYRENYKHFQLKLGAKVMPYIHLYIYDTFEHV